MITRPSSNAAASRPVLAVVGDRPRFIVREEYFGGVLYDRAGVGSAGYLERDQYEWLAARSRWRRIPVPSRTLETELVELGVISGDGRAHYEVWPATEDLPRGMLRAPIRLYFEVTRGCNLHCAYCFNSSGPGMGFVNELGTEEAIRIIGNLKRDGVPELRITGGEATVRQDTFDLIRYARDIGLAVSVNTNGVYPEERLSQMVEAQPNLLIVSLDGIDPRVHKKLRGNNQEMILRNLDLFRAAGLKVRVNMSLNLTTIEGDLIERSVRYLVEHGLEVCLILLRPSGRVTAQMVRDSFLLAGRLHDVMGRIRKLREEFPEARIQTSFDIISPRDVKPAPDLDLNTCAAGIAGCNINSRGEFAACAFLAEMDRSYNWGTIRDTEYSVLPFWREDPGLKLFRQRSVAKAKGCLSCKYYLVRCQGTCIVQEYWRDMGPDRFDPYCRIEVEDHFRKRGEPIRE